MAVRHRLHSDARTKIMETSFRSHANGQRTHSARDKMAVTLLVEVKQFLLTPMGILSHSSAHARPSTQPPINVWENVCRVA